MSRPSLLRRLGTLISRSEMVALPLRNRNLGIYTLGGAISLIGMWMQRIAVGWLTWELTESGFWLGMIAFADFAPVVLIGAFSGAFADRFNRLSVLKVTQLVFFAQAAVLFVLTVSGHIDITLLVLLTTVQGIAVAFNQPARLAFVPSLVPPVDLPTAVALHSVNFNLARFIGPLFAGLAILAWDISVAFAFNALAYLTFFWTLLHVKPGPEPSPTVQRQGFLRELRAGIGYTARHPTIGPLLLLLLAIGLGGRGIDELLPGLAAAVYQSGAAGLSALASALAVGAIAGSLWLGHRGNAAGLIEIIIASWAASAVASILTVATTSLFLALPLIMVYGFCMSCAGIALQTTVQLASEHHMLGRVMGIYSLIFRGAPAIGALAVGSLSTFLGLRWPIVLGGIAVLGVCWWTYRRRIAIAAGLKAKITPAGPGTSVKAS